MNFIISQFRKTELGAVAHNYNPSIWKAGQEGSQVRDQPGQEPMSKKFNETG
jgi:hypothetical protein